MDEAIAPPSPMLLPLEGRAWFEFAALLPAQPPLWMCLALPPLILLVEAGWYVVVALAFSSTRPRAAYLRSKRWIDRLAGSVLGVLGVRLIVDAGRPG